MRPVLIGPAYPYRGGIAHYTSMLAQALSERGVPFQVVSFCRQYPRWLYPGKSDKDPSAKPLRVDAKYWLDPFYPWTWWRAAREIVRWASDLVIIQWWVTFWAPAFYFLARWLRRRGIKVVFVIHNVMPHEPRFWDRPLARLALSQGSSFVVQTARERERLLALLPTADIVLIPLPLYHMFAGQRLSPARAREILHLPANEPVGLFFGIVRPYKGLKYALQAVALLLRQGYPLHLLVAGEFWEDLKSYQQMIDELGLSAYVRIDPRYIPDEEVGQYFSAADVFIAPYVDGTQSAAVKVALGFDIPLVISTAIASEELETDTVHNIHWVPPADPAAIAEAVRQCLQQDRSEGASHSSSDGSKDWDHLIDELEKLAAAR